VRKSGAELVSDQGYANLLSLVQRQILAGRERVRRLVEAETVKLYWDVGGLVGDFLSSADQIYGKRVISRLASDTGLGERLLYEAIQFRRQIPNLNTCSNLTWSHYRKILRVYDKAGRDFYLRLAEENGWSVRDLSEQIQNSSFERFLGITFEDQPPADSPSARLQMKRGEPYVYRVIEKNGRRALDLGFRATQVLREPFSDLPPGSIVRSRPDARYQTGYRIEVQDQRRRIYAFPATVARIIDGDTLWATIDLGFDHTLDVKLRLGGIDTPELGTPGGLRAKDHLTGLLREGGVFVVTTTKIDLYDRYLADLFVQPGPANTEDSADVRGIAAEGLFVNRKMVSDGLARIWTNTKPPEF
jgi:endonuclease YncB( thermonuclease family)